MLAPDEGESVWVVDTMPMGSLTKWLVHGLLTRDHFAAQIREEMAALFETQAKAVMSALGPVVDHAAIVAAQTELATLARKYEADMDAQAKLYREPTDTH